MKHTMNSYEYIMRLQSHMLEAACLRTNLSQDEYFGKEAERLAAKYNNVNNDVRAEHVLTEKERERFYSIGVTMESMRTERMGDPKKVTEPSAEEQALAAERKALEDKIEAAQDARRRELIHQVNGHLKVMETCGLRAQLYLAMAAGAIDGLMLGDDGPKPVVASVHKVGTILGIAPDKLAAVEEAIRDMTGVMPEKLVSVESGEV